MSNPTSTTARRLWAAIEPIHASAYFDPTATDALRSVGLRGWWMCYFAGRFGPLGEIGAGPATAMAFGFAPTMVARSLPDAWRYIEPSAAVDTWSKAAGAALRDRLAALAGDTLAELDPLLASAVTACRFDGRPLAAGWRDVARTGDPFVDLWLQTTVLREHRGDGHVLAAVTAGLTGLEATLTNVATGAVPREVMQRSRGWTDDDWEEAVGRLQQRGTLAAGGELTEAGRQLRHDIETATDRLAAGPIDHLGPAGVERVIEITAPLSRHLIDRGVIPVPNPIGAPRP